VEGQLDAAEAIVRDLADPPRSMVFVPMRTSRVDLGMAVFTYKNPKGMVMFGDADSPTAQLGWQYLEWLHLIVNAATLALARKIELGQPIT
jgi:hypothetical protein